jgi:hypothetical protein
VDCVNFIIAGSWINFMVFFGARLIIFGKLLTHLIKGVYSAG